VENKTTRPMLSASPASSPLLLPLPTMAVPAMKVEGEQAEGLEVHLHRSAKSHPTRKPLRAMVVWMVRSTKHR
jgi:hypothetical protein